MKILVLNYEYPPIGGGASPVSKELAEAYVKLGHDVTVLTMAFRGLPHFEDINGVKIIRVKCIRKKKAICHPWEQLTYIWSAYRYLQNLNIKFDYIHAHFIIPTGVVGVWFAKKTNTKLIITAHGSDVIGHNNSRFKLLYTILKRPWRSIVCNSTKVVAPSDYLIRLMQKTEPNGHYFMIPNGVDKDIFLPLVKKKKILLMSRLQKTKGIQDVISALYKIKTELKFWEVNILGDGPYKDTLQSQVRECQLEDIVYFRGWIENKSEEHLKFLGEADIYISASTIENCPMSVLEALSAGCKLILSDIPAHRQLINDDRVFFDCNNIDALCEKIIYNMNLNMKTETNEKKKNSVLSWNDVAIRYLELMK